MICYCSEDLKISHIVDSIIVKLSFLLKGEDDMMIDETIFKLKNLTSSDISSFEKIFDLKISVWWNLKTFWCSAIWVWFWLWWFCYV